MAAGVLGVLADPLLRNAPWGLGLPVWMILFAAAVVAVVAVVRQTGRLLSIESRIWLGLAIIFAATVAWRDAGTLLGFDVVAMLAALVLLALSLSAAPAPSLASVRLRDLIRTTFRTGIDVAVGAIPLAFGDAELQSVAPAPSRHRMAIAVRALLITAPVLLVFTLLLTDADPLFGALVKLPDIQFDVVLSHLFVAGFFAWIVAGWLRQWLVAASPELSSAGSPPLALNATDLLLSLGALNLLFAVFVAVQIGWLFGGAALVLRTTGLSYAEYARRGFFELIWVAGLLLPLLLGARALIPGSDGRAIALYRRLSLPLVLLLGAIMISAGARMNLYIHYYGISADRLYATTFMVWLAIVFAWFAVTVLRSRPRTFAAGAVVSGFLVLLALNALNPDGLVARVNLARGAAGHAVGPGPDWRYLASLGGDAVPALVDALASSPGDADVKQRDEQCAAAQALLSRWSGDSTQRMSLHWTQWNAGRAGALRAVRSHHAELVRAACRETSKQPA